MLSPGEVDESGAGGAAREETGVDRALEFAAGRKWRYKAPPAPTTSSAAIPVAIMNKFGPELFGTAAASSEPSALEPNRVPNDFSDAE